MIRPKPTSGGRRRSAAISCPSTRASSLLSPPPPYSFGQVGAVQPRAAMTSSHCFTSGFGVRRRAAAPARLLVLAERRATSTAARWRAARRASRGGRFRGWPSRPPEGIASIVTANREKSLPLQHGGRRSVAAGRGGVLLVANTAATERRPAWVGGPPRRYPGAVIGGRSTRSPVPEHEDRDLERELVARAAATACAPAPHLHDAPAPHLHDLISHKPRCSHGVVDFVCPYIAEHHRAS